MINKPTKKVLLSLTLATAANGCTNHSEQTTTNPSALTETHAQRLEVQLVARHVSGQYGVSAAEILDYHPQTQSIFVVNAQSGQVDILDATSIGAAKDMLEKHNINPLTLNNLSKKSSLNLAADLKLSRLGAVNSVAIHHNLLAVAIERGDNQGNPSQGRGFIGFYRIQNTGQLHYLHAVEVGYLPDNVVFTHDGNKVLVANEGEPNDAYSVDPEGSVSIIRVTNGVPDKHVINLSFRDFNAAGSRYHELPQGLKINGPGATVAQDLEPEYITVSPDNLQAFVSLQENNGLAVIDLNRDEIQTIFALGSKHYGESNNAIDASDKDGSINIQAYQGVYGLYQPDTIASYSTHGETFIITANEGDARDYTGFSEEIRAAKLPLDSHHPQVAAINDKKQLGRLKVTNSIGDTDNDGDFDRIYSYGARSFSIWNSQGEQVFDSGNDFDRITAQRLGMHFNNNNSKNKQDNRSDDKGAEPEALALGKIDERQYAFIGLERTSGFMIYDITSPQKAYFVDYIVNRDFTSKFEIDQGQVIKGNGGNIGDLGPEGMKFVTAQNSPSGQPLLMIANEVSGTTSIYQLTH